MNTRNARVPARRQPLVAVVVHELDAGDADDAGRAAGRRRPRLAQRRRARHKARQGRDAGRQRRERRHQHLTRRSACNTEPLPLYRPCSGGASVCQSEVGQPEMKLASPAVVLRCNTAQKRHFRTRLLQHGVAESFDQGRRKLQPASCGAVLVYAVWPGWRRRSVTVACRPACCLLNSVLLVSTESRPERRSRGLRNVAVAAIGPYKCAEALQDKCRKYPGTQGRQSHQAEFARRQSAELHQAGAPAGPKPCSRPSGATLRLCGTFVLAAGEPKVVPCSRYSMLDCAGVVPAATQQVESLLAKAWRKWNLCCACVGLRTTIETLLESHGGICACSAAQTFGGVSQRIFGRKRSITCLDHCTSAFRTRCQLAPSLPLCIVR